MGYKQIQQALQRKVTLTEMSFPQQHQLFRVLQEVKKLVLVLFTPSLPVLLELFFDLKCSYLR